MNTTKSHSGHSGENSDHLGRYTKAKEKGESYKSNISIEGVAHKEDWESFPLTQQQGIFLQSWNYGQMASSLGQTPHYLRLTSNDRTLGQCLALTVRARRGTHLYLPYGPVLSEWSEPVLTSLIDHLKSLGQKEGACFIKMSPFVADTTENLDLVHSVGFKNAPIHVLTETAWHLNLKTPEGEDPYPHLLMNMEKKHRNLIRRAEKEGVTITKSTSNDDLEAFWTLYAETAERHGFVRYPRSYLENQLKLFGEDNQAIMLSAQYKGKTIASSMIMYYGQTAAYHHGASSSDPQYRKIPASYLMQWEAIKEAKRRNCHTYSFWGIAPYHLDQDGKRVYEDPNHPFCGITHFKTGFGGKRVDLLPAQDLPLSKKYILNYIVEKTRHWKRGF